MATFNTILPQLTNQLKPVRTQAEIDQIDVKAQRVIAFARKQPVFNQSHEKLITNYTKALSEAKSDLSKRTSNCNFSYKKLAIATVALSACSLYVLALNHFLNSHFSSEQEESKTTQTDMVCSAWNELLNKNAAQLKDMWTAGQLLLQAVPKALPSPDDLETLNSTILETIHIRIPEIVKSILFPIGESFNPYYFYKSQYKLFTNMFNNPPLNCTSLLNDINKYRQLLCEYTQTT